jgi:hypothetical protein
MLPLLTKQKLHALVAFKERRRSEAPVLPGIVPAYPSFAMGDHPRGRGRRSQGAAMRGTRDLYVRGLRGLDRLLAAASPRRAGVGRPTSRVFGAGGDRYSEEELMRELARAMQARRGAARRRPRALAEAGRRSPARRL